MDHNHTESCNCKPMSSVSQNLLELEFERGIWTAALYNELDRLKMFISKGQTNDRDNSGYSALHYAARKGFYDACQLLINSGAEINAKTNGGATSLHRACGMGHLQIVKLLISNNADPYVQDGDGQTILHRAVQTGNEEMIKFINNLDGNLAQVKDNNGRTAEDLVDEKFPQLKFIFGKEFN